MPSDSVSLTPHQLFALFTRHRQLLLVPAIVGAVVAAFSTLVIPRDWAASQGLVIRSDAAGYADQRLGKFTDLSEMKTYQETLLELVRSKTVVSAVLGEVVTRGATPTPQQIQDFRDQLRFTPPGGAEFGKTEVFYLGVLDPDRERAIALVEALTRQLENRTRSLRDQQAGSMVHEIEQSVAVAREQLHLHADRLSAFEEAIGADLIELRHLTSPNGGQSEFGQRVLAIESERRQSMERRRQNEALLVELRAAVSDPDRLIATPDALLTSQPGVRRLKDGLVDAQLTVARLAGTRTPDHPFVTAARRSQQQVAAELLRELPTAIAGVEIELSVSAQREAELAGQIETLRGRSAKLASKRSDYAELVANVDSRSRVLEGALKQLADAKAHQAGAGSASLLARIDAIETGVNPVGPGRTTVTAAGGLAGLLLGGTLVFLLHGSTPPPTANGRPAGAGPAGAQRPEAAAPWAAEAVRSQAASQVEFGYAKPTPGGVWAAPADRTDATVANDPAASIGA